MTGVLLAFVKPLACWGCLYFPNLKSPFVRIACHAADAIYLQALQQVSTLCCDQEEAAGGLGCQPLLQGLRPLLMTLNMVNDSIEE